MPKGWSLPKGNVSMLFNLWVQGNALMGIAPYRFLKSWDLIPLEERMDMPLVLSAKERASTLARTARTWKAYLSQANDVMLVIQEGAGLTWQQLAALSASEREGSFIASFQAMCRRLHPDISDEARDARRLNEMSYLSVFSALSKKAMLRTTLGKRKRKRAATEQEEESEEEEQTMRRRRRVRRRTGHEEESEEE